MARVHNNHNQRRTWRLMTFHVVDRRSKRLIFRCRRPIAKIWACKISKVAVSASQDHLWKPQVEPRWPALINYLTIHLRVRLTTTPLSPWRAWDSPFRKRTSKIRKSENLRRRARSFSISSCFSFWMCCLRFQRLKKPSMTNTTLITYRSQRLPRKTLCKRRLRTKEKSWLRL